MSFDFLIPLNLEDLLHPDGNNYVVRDTYPPIELPEKLNECRTLQKECGSSFILQCFDTLFSVVHQFASVDQGIKEQAWDLIFSGAAQHGSELCLLLDDSNDLDPQSKTQNVNILKMLTYMLCQITELFENEFSKPSNDVVINVGKGKKKQTKKQAAGFLEDWDVLREKYLHCLNQLCMLPLNKLFDPPVVEEEFVNLICNTSYKLLENPALCRQKSIKDSIFNLLGIHIKKYNHGTGCSLKIIQLLRHFEHLVSPLAYGVGIFVNNFGAKTIISDIVREIGCMNESDLTRDNSETRAYSQFLVEIAQNMPKFVLPTISLLLPHLNGDIYSMRNCVLEIMGEIVLKVLSDSEIDDKAKNLRKEFLDQIEDHIHDNNAFVRCRAIQIWNKLCTERAIPLRRQLKIFSLIIGRLEDKSSNVRKYCIQALKTFLESNPYAAKLPLEELQLSLEKESKKLDELCSSQSSSETDPCKSKENSWEDVESQVMQIIEELSQLDSHSNDDEYCEDILLSDVIKNMKEHFKKFEIKEGIISLKNAIKNWPDCQLFKKDSIKSENGSGAESSENQEENDSTNTNDNEEDSEKGTEKNEIDQQQLVEIVRKIYLDVHSKKDGECEEIVELEMSSDLQKAAETVFTQENAPTNPDLIINGVVISEVNKQRVLVHYLKDCVLFANQVNRAIPIICQLLGSKTNSDVLEAIEFFVIAHEFGVQNALIGVRKMLLLIWSSESGIKESVVNAYKKLYLNPQSQNERSKALAIVSNLTELMKNLTIGEMTSLEELISELMKSKELSRHVIQVLWEKFSLKLPNTSIVESNVALQLLSMAANAEVAIIGSNIDVLVTMGLGDRAKDDFALVRDTCIAFMKLAVPLKTDSTEEPVRFAENHEFFSRSAEILIQGVIKLDDSNWVPMAEQCIAAIYKLSEKPDVICNRIIKELFEVYKLDDFDQILSQDNKEPETSVYDMNSEILSRIVFLIGQLALHQLIHLELNIASELKRRQFVKEEQLNFKKNKRKSHLSSRPSLSVNRSKDKSGSESIEDEMGLTGAIADDAEAEFLRKICESDIVTGSNLLAKLAPLIVTICSNPSKFKCVKLRSAAALALAKYMLMSSEFCEQHLPLLFTILERSPEPLIRANTIVALGDLSFRFPNLIEPWTPHLYGRLRDESVNVRKNTLMVLTHLILNDMVKVKGQISDMAICIIDEEYRISGLARLFFSELSQKGNTVYNILPDIISRLSDPSNGVKEESFKSILEFLFSFIQKDRQVECLVEKLCHRFRATSTERQWRDIAYCLSLLTYGEKNVKKLLDNFNCFADKLGESSVYSCFMSILANAKKLAKIESKVIIQEFEDKMEEAHQKALGELQLLEKAEQAKSKNVKIEEISPEAKRNDIKKKFSKSALKVRPSLMKQNVDNTEMDDDFHSAKSEKKKKQQLNVSSRKMKKITFSSDEDDDDDDDDFSEKENEILNDVVGSTEKTTRKSSATQKDDSFTFLEEKNIKVEPGVSNFKTPSNKIVKSVNSVRRSKRKLIATERD